MIPEDGLGGGTWMKGLKLEEISKRHIEIREKLSISKTEEHKKSLSESHKGKKLSTKHKESISKGIEARYNNKEFYNDFCETMSEVNKREDKRKKAGNKIKEKWKDPEYLEKMRIRNEKSTIGEKLKCPYCNKEGGKGPMKKMAF
jgi:hypothetical protein